MTKVFINGSSGTTGLQIYERLAARRDIELISLPEALRHDAHAKQDIMNEADIVFLCLPDEAAAEDVKLIESSRTAVIDASTAHRTAPGWEYGFPELTGRRGRIAASKRVANPGCHASGFLALVEPLVRAGLIPPELGLFCFSLTGYSGGGKKMIAQYEDGERAPLFDSPRQYGLAQAHKHLKEMTEISGLSRPPVFCPVVGDFYSGMETTTALFADEVNGGAGDIKALYKELYRGGAVSYADAPDEGGFLAAGAFSGRDDMEVSVLGCGERILLTARFDNLGKGASGSAVQNMNILLGIDETAGLKLGGKHEIY